MPLEFFSGKVGEAMQLLKAAESISRETCLSSYVEKSAAHFTQYLTGSRGIDCTKFLAKDKCLLLLMLCY